MIKTHMKFNRKEENNTLKEKICNNCLAKETPLWRKTKKGINLCNACGLYYRNHGEHRPSIRSTLNQKSCDEEHLRIQSMEKIAINVLVQMRINAKVSAYNGPPPNLTEIANPRSSKKSEAGLFPVENSKIHGLVHSDVFASSILQGERCSLGQHEAAQWKASTEGCRKYSMGNINRPSKSDDSEEQSDVYFGHEYVKRNNNLI